MYVRPNSFIKTVAATATPERLVAAATATKARSVIIQAERSNTGNVYVGDSNVDAGSDYGVDLGAADSVTLSAADVGGKEGYISLRDIWLDVSIAGDGVSVLYLEEVN